MKAGTCCAYCREEALTRDHVPPKGMFPEPRPTDLITVPACSTCNGEASRDDEYFRWFVATASAETPAADQLIQERVLPGFGQRPPLLRQIWEGAFPSVDVYSKGGVYLRSQPGFWFDRPRIQRTINRIVRGLYYHETSVPLGQTARMREFLLNPDISEEAQQIVASLPFRVVGGGTFIYRHMLDPQEPLASLWLMVFFETTIVLTMTEPPGRTEGTTGGPFK